MTEPLVPLPPRNLQARFRQVVEPLRAHLNCLVARNAAIGGLRDLLLPKLVTGQIDVSHLDLDALVGSVA